MSDQSVRGCCAADRHGVIGSSSIKESLISPCLASSTMYTEPAGRGRNRTCPNSGISRATSRASPPAARAVTNHCSRRQCAVPPRFSVSFLCCASLGTGISCRLGSHNHQADGHSMFTRSCGRRFSRQKTLPLGLPEVDEPAQPLEKCGVRTQETGERHFCAMRRHLRGLLISRTMPIVTFMSWTRASP